MASSLKDVFDLEYVTADRAAKRVLVQVKLSVLASSHKLQAIKVADKKCKVLEDLWLEDIGAVVVTELIQKKKQQQRCLFLFWKRNEIDTLWNHILFIDNNLPNCGIEQLKTSITTKCMSGGLFQMNPVPEGTVHELQCSQSYVAVVPVDGHHVSSLKHGDIDKFVAYISGLIHTKSSDEISLINQPNGATGYITLRTANDVTHNYTLYSGKTADMVSRQISHRRVPRSARSPLPPTPKLELQLPPKPFFPRTVSRDDGVCGAAPSFQERPFWLPVLVPPNPESFEPFIYTPESNIKQYLPKKMQHIKTVCTRQPSRRFDEFLNAVNFQPAMVEEPDSNSSASNSKHLYRHPRLSRQIHEQPTISTQNFPKDNVESTLAECLRKIVRNTFNDIDETEHCPIGMTGEEREMFCMRLDLVENDVITGTGWKVFAQTVMYLNNDDVEMIDEFSCKYKCQVVEVILDHWCKLYSMVSRKCKYCANKQTIIQVLTKMDKLDLLKRLRWDPDDREMSPPCRQ